MISEFELIAMNHETTEYLRQEWYKYPFDWVMEGYVTVHSEQAGRLILMQVERFTGLSKDGYPTCGIRAVPVLHSAMATYKGANNEQ